MHEVARCLRDALGMTNIEPAHMDLAEPSVAAAFDRCVASGARLVVVVPYFLGSGRHVEEDIPHLAAEAAAKHPHIEHRIASPLGLHPLIMGVIRQRIEECIAQDVSAQDVSDSADCGDVDDLTTC